MQAKLTQLRGILWHELLIHWRQKTFLIAFLLVNATVLLIGKLFSTETGMSTNTETLRRSASLGTLFTVMPVVYLFTLLLAPVLSADIFVRDKLADVRELLRSMPLSMTNYVIGKLLGLCTIITLTICIITFICGVVWWVIIYPLPISEFLISWLGILLPSALFSGCLGALVVAGQPTRRRALLLALGFAICTVLAIGGAWNMNAIPSWLDYLNPSRPLLLRYYLTSVVSTLSSGRESILGLTLMSYVLTLVVGLAEVALGVGLVQHWLNTHPD